MKKPLGIALALLLLSPSAGAEVRLADFVQILGKVTSAARPIDDALVIALDLSNFTTVQVSTGKDGNFVLPPLRSSIYRLFAIKHGFAPAIATVLPIRASESISLDLRRDEEAFRNARDQIWAIRSALPPDVLREIDLGPVVESDSAAPSPARLQGTMVSMTAMSMDEQSAAPQVAQTMVGLQGDVGRGWNLGFEGNLRRYEQTLQERQQERPVSESQGVVMELRSLPGEEAYRLVSTRSSWNPSELDGTTQGRGFVDLEEHRLEWQNQRSRVGMEYFSQENVFRNSYGSERLEVSGDHVLMESARSKFGLGMRIAQETMLSSIADDPYRAIDLIASGAVRAATPVQIHYGVRSRFTADGSELTPETSAEITIRPGAVFVVSSSYKVYSTIGDGAPGALLVGDTRGSGSPRYAWSVGFIGGDPEEANVRIVASMQEIDSEVRLLLDDQMEQIWEGLDFLPGDVWRDVSIDVSRTLLDRIILALSASSGDGRNPVTTDEGTRRYVSGAFRSYYRPSGTSIDVSYRQVDNDLRLAGDQPVALERVKIRMGQSLHLPIDLRLLVGVELAREIPDAVADSDASDMQKRYLGGIAFAF